MALHNQREGYTRTFVIADADKKVVAYHSLCAGMISRNEAPRVIGGHGAPGEIPVALLARWRLIIGVNGGAGRRVVKERVSLGRLQRAARRLPQ